MDSKHGGTTDPASFFNVKAPREILRTLKAASKRKLRPMVLMWWALKAQLKPKLKIDVFRSGKKKRALLCYLLDAVDMRDSDPRLRGHANWWRGRELARILDFLGYSVDVIASGDGSTIPPCQYDLIFDASANLPRLAPFQKKDTKLVLFLTGSYYGWSAPAEMRRILDFETAHGVFYEPRYGRQPKVLMDKALAMADLALLVGNETTLHTYPDWARKNMRTVRMPASFIEHRKRFGERTDTFLYFSSARNVLKGLDLLFDVFVEHPEWTLVVVGPVESTEPDFFKAYPDLSGHSNIRLLGSMLPSSAKFAEVLDRCDAFLLPSCSEGTSSSALTCCVAGIYPILSRNSGVDIVDGMGTWIESLTKSGVEKAIVSFRAKDWSKIAREADAIRTDIANKHSRKAFSNELTDILAGLDGKPAMLRDPISTHDWAKSLSLDVANNRIFS